MPLGDTTMNELYTWISFLAAPLLLILIIAYVYRPSARWKYQEAKKVPFEEKDG